MAASIAHADVQVATAPAPAHHRIVLIGMPDAVFDAASAALGPWSISVEASSEAVPATNADAATIAHAHSATAVAWIDRGELVVYDDLRGVSVRHATPPATDDVSATAIALSIKTSLRSPPTVVAVNETVTTPVVSLATPAAPRSYQPHLVAGFGAGIPLQASAPVMMRFDGQLSLELARFQHLGPLVGVEAGPSAAVNTTEITGSYSDVAIDAGAEWRRPLTPTIALVPAIAGTLHLTHLDGTIAGNGNGNRAVAQSAYPAGVELSVGVEAGRRVRGGATVYGTFLAGTDRYMVRGESVLTIPAATVGVSLRISFQ
jgi:hypothetical protein